MNKSPGRKKRYSLLYVIYRRVRYVRYLKRKRRRIRRELKRADKEERKAIKLAAKKQRKVEVAMARQKRKAEKEHFIEEQARMREEMEEKRIEDERMRKAFEKRQKALEDREKYFQKRKRRRLLKVYLRAVRRNTLRSLRSINLKNLRALLRSYRESATGRKQFWSIMVSSLSLFLLSYFTIYMIGQLATAVAGLFFDYSMTIYYWDVYFNITVDQWTPDSIKTIYLSGPVVIAFVGIVAMIIYSNLREFTFHFKLFYLWCVVHALSMFFGAMLIGMLFDRGVGYAISWMYVTDTGKLLYSIISIFFLVVSGFILTKPFLISGNTFYNSISDNNRAQFIHAQITLPYLLGVFILFLVRQPRFIFYDTFITFTAFLILLPVLGTAMNYGDLYFENENKEVKIRWLSVLLAVGAILFFRGILEIGLPIG